MDMSGFLYIVMLACWGGIGVIAQLAQEEEFPVVDLLGRIQFEADATCDQAVAATRNTLRSSFGVPEKDITITRTCGNNAPVAARLRRLGEDNEQEMLWIMPFTIRVDEEQAAGLVGFSTGRTCAKNVQNHLQIYLNQENKNMSFFRFKRIKLKFPRVGKYVSLDGEVSFEVSSATCRQVKLALANVFEDTFEADEEDEQFRLGCDPTKSGGATQSAWNVSFTVDVPEDEVAAYRTLCSTSERWKGGVGQHLQLRLSEAGADTGFYHFKSLTLASDAAASTTGSDTMYYTAMGVIGAMLIGVCLYYWFSQKASDSQQADVPISRQAKSQGIELAETTSIHNLGSQP